MMSPWDVFPSGDIHVITFLILSERMSRVPFFPVENLPRHPLFETVHVTSFPVAFHTPPLDVFP